MKNSTHKSKANFIHRLTSFMFSRFTQSPDVYPIKFYKKRKHRKSGYLYSSYDF
ncbi:MAG: hypothetical protein RL172_3194 [Bacteroidota bacterium]|jgi:hypothetical protein